MFQKGRERVRLPRNRSRSTPDRPAVEAARRDPRRFDALYRKYVAQMYSFALYETRDHHAAEDLTEQVFLHALRGLPRFRERPTDGQQHVPRVALPDRAQRPLERASPRPPAPGGAARAGLDVAGAGGSAGEAVVARDELGRAWQAIERLPAERRRALVLRFVEEMSAREIGEMLGRSEGAVRVLIHRALRRCTAGETRPRPRDARDPALVARMSPKRQPSRSTRTSTSCWRVATRVRARGASGR